MTSGHISRPYLVAVSGAILLGIAGCAPAEPSVVSASEDSVVRAYPEAPLLDRMVTCMEDAGWEVQVDWQGGFSGPEMSSDSAAQWTDASDACADEVGYFDVALNDSQLAELYEQEVDEHDCLIALGQPSDEPPSAQTYVESYQSATQYFAIAKVLALQLPDSQTKKITQECAPPTWFLNVSGM